MHKVKFETIHGNDFVRLFVTREAAIEYIEAYEQALRQGLALFVTADSLGIRGWIHGKANA